MPVKYVNPSIKEHKPAYNDAEAIAEAVQRPPMKFVATKTAEQLDLQALHRVRERLVSQRTGIVNYRDAGGDKSLPRSSASGPSDWRPTFSLICGEPQPEGGELNMGKWWVN